MGEVALKVLIFLAIVAAGTFAIALVMLAIKLGMELFS